MPVGVASDDIHTRCFPVYPVGFSEQPYVERSSKVIIQLSSLYQGMSPGDGGFSKSGLSTFKHIYCRKKPLSRPVILLGGCSPAWNVFFDDGYYRFDRIRFYKQPAGFNRQTVSENGKTPLPVAGEYDA